jgi:hypothetical protein
VSETVPPYTCNCGGKKYLIEEELHEIMQNSSYEEYVESEEKEDNEKNNVQIEEEIEDETEASALQRKEDSDEVFAALCTINQNLFI